MEKQEKSLREKLHALGKSYLKVFLVDYDFMYLKTMKHQLNHVFSGKIQVETFLSGADCLESMHLNPDVVVIDHFLDEDDKGMTGLDYLNKIKKGFKEVEVIMISATNDIRLAAYSLRKGAIGFVDKSKNAMSSLLQNIQKAIYKMAKNKENKDTKNFRIVLGARIGVILVGLTLMNGLGV